MKLRTFWEGEVAHAGGAPLPQDTPLLLEFYTDYTYEL